MAGQGGQVDCCMALDVNGQVSGSLHGVGMEQHAVLQQTVPISAMG